MGVDINVRVRVMYDALVEVIGSRVIAKDADHNTIAEGDAGADESTVIQAANDALSEGLVWVKNIDPSSVTVTPGTNITIAYQYQGKITLTGAFSNIANGFLKLDSSALVPLAQIPATLTGKDADTVDTYHAAALEKVANKNVANGYTGRDADNDTTTSVDAADYGGGFSTYTPPTGSEGAIRVAIDTNATTPGQRLYAYGNGAWHYVDLT